MTYEVTSPITNMNAPQSTDCKYHAGAAFQEAFRCAYYSLVTAANGQGVATNTPAAKRQPWKAVWPAPRESQSQANMFGFKKGEVMVFDGNAGNFFAREQWEVWYRFFL